MGVPVIATEACGLDGISGAKTVSADDVEALRDAVAQAVNGRQGCDSNRDQICSDPTNRAVLLSH
jgi:glycosyltransferase involved in cell wall biosynthesis